MKYILILYMLIMTNVHAQTNIINIYNSKVTINNPEKRLHREPLNGSLRKLKVEVKQPVISIENTNKFVLTQEMMQKLQWEGMLEQRRNVAFRSYLNQRF